MTNSDIQELTYQLFKMFIRESDLEDKKDFKKVKIKVSNEYYK